MNINSTTLLAETQRMNRKNNDNYNFNIANNT